MAQLKYDNVKTPSSKSDTQVESYDSVTISKSEYQKLKGQKSQDSETEVPDGKKLVDNDDWNELQEEVDEKNQRIDELEQEVRDLKDRIQELTSQINQSEAEEGNRSGSPQEEPANRGNTEEEVTGNEQVEEKRPGFANQLLSSIFG